MHRAVRNLSVAVAAAVLVLAGCTGGRELDPEPTGPVPPPPPIATTHTPDEVPVLLASQRPEEMALAVSERYFASAHIVVMAPVDDQAAIARAASISMAAGTPLLLTGTPGGGLAVEAELVRLSTHSVITVGAVDVADFDVTALDIVPAPADAADLGEILGLDLTAVDGSHLGPEPAEPPDELAQDPEDTDGDGAGEDETGTEDDAASGDDAAGSGSDGTGADADDGDGDNSGSGGDGSGTTDSSGTDESSATGADEASGDQTSGDEARENGDGDGSGEGENGDGDGSGESENGNGEEGTDADGGAVGAGSYVEALIYMSVGEVLDVEPADDTTPEPVGEISPTEPTERLDGPIVLADGEPEQAAAIGIARAAGATVVLTEQINSGVMSEISGADSILGLGTSFGDDAEFSWRVLTAATGTELPGGGQEVFGGKRYIALYGHPVTPVLGVLGEQGTEETIDLAAEYAEPYTELTEDQVIPALEIIVTVATTGAGEDGMYSNAWPSETFIPLIEAAEEAGQYVVLDFQPGRNHFVDQIEMYEDLLAYPHVGVALDPEWRLRPDQVHLSQIGHVEAEEVNEVVDYLAEFVIEHDLPQKMLVLHQFQIQMIRDRDQVDTSRPQVAVLIHADGQGPVPSKFDTWNVLHRDAPEGIAWGWKNFIDEDDPMMTPEETYDVEPVPEFVSYQ
ncbi:hypothetical protein ACO0LV_02270 [Pseudactinotalea sp. Z1739]|uniref:hypothetical protein n=1 Tax=Pseudactinotalea sp. Z1739 TaxID=3413028 RepID=UPI003C7E32B4